MSDAPRRHLPQESNRSQSVSQDLLYDPSIASLSHAERARTLLAKAYNATLCTLSSDGYPYGSLVLFALHEPSGDAVLLVSELAEHTRNLRADKRCSLLVAETGDGEALARGRVTLVGNAHVGDNPCPELLDSFLRKNPNAKRYASFGDFAVWRIVVSSVRYIGGFGRMSWIDIANWRDARPDALAFESTCDLLARLNQPEKASRLAKVALLHSYASSVSAVKTNSVDQYGIEFDAQTNVGPRPIRVAFKRPAVDVSDSEHLIEELEREALT